MKIRPVNQFIPSTGVEMAFVKGVMAAVNSYNGEDKTTVASSGLKAVREFFGIGNMITISEFMDKPVIVEFPVLADGSYRKLYRDNIGLYLDVEVDEDKVKSAEENHVDEQAILDAITSIGLLVSAII